MPDRFTSYRSICCQFEFRDIRYLLAVSARTFREEKEET